MCEVEARQWQWQLAAVAAVAIAIAAAVLAVILIVLVVVAVAATATVAAPFVIAVTCLNLPTPVPLNNNMLDTAAGSQAQSVLLVAGFNGLLARPATVATEEQEPAGGWFPVSAAYRRGQAPSSGLSLGRPLAALSSNEPLAAPNKALLVTCGDNAEATAPDSQWLSCSHRFPESEESL